MINFGDARTLPEGLYYVLHDVVANLDRLRECGHEDSVKIYDPMFSHRAIHNAANYARHAALLKRRGRARKPVKLLPPSGAPEAADHIICLGGYGCVHKGLDLTLEAFARRKDYELYVCGRATGNGEFVSMYQNELKRLPNVHDMDWMDTKRTESRAPRGQ